MILTFYWIYTVFKINRKYFFRSRKVKWILFYIIFRLLYWRVYIEPYRWFPYGNTTFNKDQIKSKTFFLSTLIALNVKWVPCLIDLFKLFWLYRRLYQRWYIGKEFYDKFFQLHGFFINSTLISNTRLKMAKN